MTAKEIIERYEMANEFGPYEIRQTAWGDVPGMQENDYSIYTSISEVYKKRVVTEEYLTEEEIECGGYEFV